MPLARPRNVFEIYLEPGFKSCRGDAMEPFQIRNQLKWSSEGLKGFHPLQFSSASIASSTPNVESSCSLVFSFARR